jgi:hypothetical protein
MKKLVLYFIAAVCTLCTLPIAACAKDGGNLSQYVISATYKESEQKLYASLNFTYYNDTDNEISDLKFNLWGNAYRQGATYSPVSQAYSAKAYYNGESYGEEVVEKVENCSAWEIAGEDENILVVNLLTPVYPQDTTQISIEYTLTLADVNHRTGVTQSTVNLGNFYPILCEYSTAGFSENPYISCGDPFVSACANYDITLTFPLKYNCASSAQMVSESKAGTNKVCRYTLENARDCAFVLSDKFEVLSESVGETTINYYYYKDENPQTTLNAACESFSYFSQTFGSYCYPQLSVVQTGFCMGGMEYPALTMVSDALDSTTALYTVVHENAHQWWYAMVGSDQYNNGWQDEGLAEYSTLMFFEKTPNYGFTRTGLLGSATKSYRAFYSVYSQIFGDADTTMTRPLSAFVSDYEYANIAYNKGLLLFEAVRTAVGDDKFVAGLQSYFEANKFAITTPEELYSHFTSTSGVESIFTSFVEGKIII